VNIGAARRESTTAGCRRFHFDGRTPPSLRSSERRNWTAIVREDKRLRQRGGEVTAQRVDENKTINE
jgi:hypothetical protein